MTLRLKPDFPEHDTVIQLSRAGPSVLACGAWLKNTVCVTRGDKAYVSQLIGDLGTPESCQMLEQTVNRLCTRLDVEPEIVAHDLHPDFFSTRYAQSYAAERQLPAISVQHHHAHIAALCAEHSITDPVLGLALDGVGLGTDGTFWGGELLLVTGTRFQRVGHLAPLAMPGGDRAAQEPWRMASAVLFGLGRGDQIVTRFPAQPGSMTIATMLQRGLNCPATSSTGRLFDAAAGLLGVSKVQAFEAEAAIALQALADGHGAVSPLSGGFRIAEDGVLDFTPLLAMLADCPDPAYGAALFHATLAYGMALWACQAADRLQVPAIALGGGCFHNSILSQQLGELLKHHGLRVLSAQRMQPNDSAISLGQAWVALHQA